MDFCLQNFYQTDFYLIAIPKLKRQTKGTIFNLLSKLMYNIFADRTKKSK